MAEMYAPTRHHPLAHEDYFALEQAEDQRYEYLAGEVFAMTGGSESHALIAMNTGVALANAVRDRRCRVYGADMKLFIPQYDQFCYPDVMLVCEQGLRHTRYVENPLLIVEVLSPTTESYDRGRKFEHYRSLPSLRCYLLLNQDRPHAELFEREEDGAWRLYEAGGEEGIPVFKQEAFSLRLADLYRQVDFEAGSERP